MHIFCMFTKNMFVKTLCYLSQTEKRMQAINVYFQRDMKDQLRQGLASLPRPKNDYEIVVEDLGEDMDETNEGEDFIADQADFDAQSEAEQLEKR